MALPRVFISTDLRLSSEEKDDAQSLIHALLYQDEMNIVGISGTASKWGHQNGRVEDIDAILDVYARDYPTLEAHDPAFKSPAELKAVSWQGATSVAPPAGYSQPTDSSEAIIAEAHKAAAAGEVLNVLTWGGETDIAQALHDDPSIAPHVRLFNINTQDPHAYAYIEDNFKGELDMWVDDQSTYRGMYQTPTSTGVIPGWHQENAEGHGALGDLFADLSGDIFDESGVKMGDSPTVLRFLSGDQDDPSKESWGGEFVEVSPGYWTDATSDSLDLNRSGTDGAYTIYEDRDAWMDDFAERLDRLEEGAPSAPTSPPPSSPPPSGGSGPDTITVRVSGDGYEGDPNFALLVNGRVVDSTNLVGADHGEGEWDTLVFKGDFDLDGSDRVSIEFTNDHYEGQGRDRNLHVDAVTVNGETNGRNHTFGRAGTESWDFPADPASPPSSPPPSPPTGGSGPDTITVRVSGDAYNGDPNFALTVNGRVVDATNVVGADHDEGEWDTLVFRGDFDLNGSDRVGVKFTNDLYDRGEGDRNLYVDSVTVNGETNGRDQAFLRGDTAYWDV